MRSSPNVKRVVLTSSAVTVLTPTPTPGHIYSEADWNEESEKEVLTKGGEVAGPVHIYYSAKTRAEKAAWEFIEANKGNISFDLITLLPPYIFGVCHPSIVFVRSVQIYSALVN